MRRPAGRREERDHRAHDRGGVAERARAARGVLAARHLEPEGQVARGAIEIAAAERARYGKPEHRSRAPPGILRPAARRVVAHHPPRLRRGEAVAPHRGVLDPPADEPVERRACLAPRRDRGQPAQLRAEGLMRPRLVEFRVSATAAATAAPRPVPDGRRAVAVGAAPAVHGGLARRPVSVGGQRPRPQTPQCHRPTCPPAADLQFPVVQLQRKPDSRDRGRNSTRAGQSRESSPARGRLSGDVRTLTPVMRLPRRSPDTDT